MLMMYCDHCARQTLSRVEGIVICCEDCGKVLEDLYPEYDESPITTRRGKNTKHGEKLTKKSEEDTISNSMSVAEMKEFIREMYSGASQISDNKEWNQEISSETSQISENKEWMQEISSGTSRYSVNH